MPTGQAKRSDTESALAWPSAGRVRLTTAKAAPNQRRSDMRMCFERGAVCQVTSRDYGSMTSLSLDSARSFWVTPATGPTVAAFQTLLLLGRSNLEHLGRVHPQDISWLVSVGPPMR